MIFNPGSFPCTVERFTLLIPSYLARELEKFGDLLFIVLWPGSWYGKPLSQPFHTSSNSRWVTRRKHSIHILLGVDLLLVRLYGIMSHVRHGLRSVWSRRAHIKVSALLPIARQGIIRSTWRRRHRISIRIHSIRFQAAWIFNFDHGIGTLDRRVGRLVWNLRLKVSTVCKDLLGLNFVWVNH